MNRLFNIGLVFSCLSLILSSQIPISKEDTSQSFRMESKRSRRDGMKENWDYNRCVSVLSGEIAILKKISVVQGRVRRAAMNREWVDFDENDRELNSLGGEFARLEDERAALFPAETPFYTAILELPDEQRVELSRLYRELKIETLKMRALNETFLVYLSEAKSLAAAYLEAVCPARGGKLYTRKGRKVSQDLRSIVFNNRY
jgi:hypothetical protein